MKKTITILVCIVLALVLVIAGMLVYLHFNNSDTAAWEEQYNQGVQYLNDQNYEEAIAAFKIAVDIDPTRYEAYVGQGDAYMDLEQYETAQQLYQKAYELAPENLDAVTQRLERAQRAIAKQNQQETEATEETVPETTVPVTEPVVVTAQEKKISIIKSLYNGEVGTEEAFLYNDMGKITQRITTGYNAGEQTYSYITEYLYDGAGNLLSRKDADSPFTEYEYYYDSGVLTGYTFHEIMGDVVAISTTYHYERDDDGNIVRITTTGTNEDVWTNGVYTYDGEGRCVSAYEHERYGDHEFERNMTYDYSNMGAVIVTREETMFGFTDTTRYVQFGDMEYGYINGAQMYDGYSIVTDTDGYITGVKDNNGQLVNTFEYVIVSPENNSTSPVEKPQSISFSSIPSEYTFTSGAGAWGTGLEIATDGSFEGNYHDSNMGEDGEGYPNGTVYYCNFSGKFSEPEPVNEYTYKVTLESFNVADQAGLEYIENGIKYIASEPYGFDGPNEYYIYLPGIPSSMMPQNAFDWVSRLYGSDFGSYEVYVICSANGELPFVGEFD